MIDGRLLQTIADHLRSTGLERPHGSESTVEKQPATRTNLSIYKYRIKPNQSKRNLYTNLFEVQRLIRSDVIRFIAECLASNPIEPINALPKVYTLKKLFAADDSAYVKSNPHIASLAYAFRADTVYTCHRDYLSALTKQKRDGKPFDIEADAKLRERMYGYSFRIPSECWYGDDWWSALLPANRRCLDGRSNNKLPDSIEHTATLKKHPDNKYYIHVPTAITEIKESRHALIVIDPGYRTGFTGINFTTNMLEEIGIGLSTEIALKDHSLRKLEAKIPNAINHRQRYHMKKAHALALSKISNTIDNFYKSAAKHLCDNYSTIVIPRLEPKASNSHSQSMSNIMSHSKFVDILITKSQQYSNCKVIVADEHLTTRICSRCGAYNNTLGKSKVFKCPRCHIILDRDVNAVYNILMKTLHESGFSFETKSLSDTVNGSVLA